MQFYNKKFIIERVKKKLIIGFTKRAGRNFFGRKTIFTQGGGLFKKLRIINFKRNLNCNAILLTIEKDLKRTAFIGLVCFENGLYTYLLLSHGLNSIGKMINGFNYKFLVNSANFLFNIPTGNFIHHIEYLPNKGAQLTRAAGSSSFLLSEDKDFVILKMNSGWLLKLSKFCLGIVGVVSNIDNHLIRKKNAGHNRKLGKMPKVRGVAMNPCDHPHGGGEGTGSPPKAHRTPWGKLAKSPTKNNKKFLLKKKIFKKK